MRPPPFRLGYLLLFGGRDARLARARDGPADPPDREGCVAAPLRAAAMANEQRGPLGRLLNTATTEDDRDQRDRAVVYVVGTIIGLALLLLILVLPPVSILSRGDGGGGGSSEPGTADTYTSTVRSGMPKLPAGLEAVSPLFDLSAPADARGASRVTVPLKEKQSTNSDLALYTYSGEDWQRLSDVALVAGGEAARGEVSELPGNVVVLRRTRALLQVAGSLPAGMTVDEETAPVLTTLHPIVFLALPDGTIAGEPPAVPPAGYQLVPRLVTLDQEAVNTILRSPELTTAHAQAIAETVKSGNYAGISIDYRTTSTPLRDNFTDLVSQVADALHADGRTLTLTLPAPEEKDGKMDPGAFDWEALGGLADTIEIAGELDQELYFQRMEAALDYVTERVDRSKLLLEISTLSVERGGDGLHTLTRKDALGIAATMTVQASEQITPRDRVDLIAQNLAESANASGLHWDETARAVTFSYQGLGGKRTVWIANRFSAAFRLELARRYNLGGVAFTDVSADRADADAWLPVQQLSDNGDLTLTRPNGAMFEPMWSATGGLVDPQQGATTSWTAPSEPGSYEIDLVVSDGVVRAQQQVTLEVVAPPSQ